MIIGRRNFLAGSALATTAVLAGATPGPARAATRRLRIHTLVKSPHPYNDMAAAMKEQIEAASQGALEVQIFDAGQLGQDPAVISELSLGTIDMMISTASNAAEQIPEYAIFTMPYLFGGLDGLIGHIGPGTPVQEHFEKVYAERGVGMKLLALGGSGTRNLSAAKVKVEHVADLEGLKMRTTQSPMDSATWAALGMLPVTVAWGELYAAMQTGVADAMESSLPGYNGSKLYEVAPHLALTEHTVQINHISMSQRSWDGLDAELQAVVQDAATAANKLGLDKAMQYDSELVAKLESENGVTVTRPDKQEFIDRLEPIQKELAAKLDVVEEYELLKAS
ncbi:MAG: TRAP transporter substrate-binding protein [Geminicoccaceae bacterium]|nr:TRAP transporter substrate-binding protein [Geminicoccaceae bacterium]